MLLSRFFDCGMLENKGICNYNKWILSRFFYKNQEVIQEKEVLY